MWLLALTWPASITVFLLHVAQVRPFAADRATALTVTWLLFLGCLGCPVYALHLAAGRLTIRACLLLATASGAVAGLLTLLFLLRDLTATPLNEGFSLALPMAFAVQAYNAAASRARSARAVRDAVREYDTEHHANPCPACNLRAQIDTQHERLRRLSCLDGLPDEEKDGIIAAVAEALESKNGAQLHVVNGHSSNRERARRNN